VVTVLVFPGQGAQKVGMGRDLADRYPEARRVFEEVDDALGASLSRLMWEGPEEQLTLTHNAQPAILAHSAAALAVAQPALGNVALAAGHSLGEYTAYIAAGSLGVADAARLVRRRGELMLEAGKARPGAMSAVLGLETDAVAICCAEASGADGVVVAANLNAPDQTVISGDPEAVAAAGEGCKAAGARRVLPLKVSGAFHSPLMAPAVPGLREALDQVAFAAPSFPVVANATAAPVGTAEEARALLVDQLTAPVRWVECMETASRLHPDARFLELGPGTVLAGLLKRIVAGKAATSIGTADEMEKFLA
jgi:[acyl-carrier-protein] S-malonyltransferase